MPTFTSELWRVIDRTPPDMSRDEYLGLHDYPIFDADYRDTLNEHIIDYYINREIGVESVDMFRHAVRRKMRLTMPYYNKLYELQRKEFDPLRTIDMKTVTLNDTESTTDNTTETNTTSDNTSGSRAVNSQFPQTMLNGSGDYATSATDSNSQTEGTANSSEEANIKNQAVDNGESTTQGYQGNPSDILMSYRESLMNVDEMVINELSDCFMLIWNTSDAYTY